MKTETLQFDTANGATTAFVAMPDETNENTRGVVLIQEWWGLNEHIKDIARRYADEGFTAIAPDLYRGKLATDPQEAGAMMQALKVDDGIDTIKNAIDAAREKYGFEHF
ncbi:MAG TPA: dienelactone hydrolase family protein, partial [Pyrinomonadaceae bacterium]|nr:dienelactone hydrolase family protein [Pyrinomonadaceae bacterium]